jgi:hypothetical protein
MAYYGATAASSLSNPPILLARGMASGGNTTAFGSGPQNGGGLWLYTSSHSATEASSGTNSGAFFSDAWALGMRTGDVMMMAGTTGSTYGFAVGVMYVTSGTTYAYLSTGSQANSTGGS